MSSLRSLVLPNGLHALLISDPTERPQLADRNNTAEDDHSEDGASVASATEEPSDSEDEADGSEAGDEGDEAGEKLAAAALSIGVGSFSDPRAVQGLAHFLEHMIFMGSKKYPTENEYDAYISVSTAKDLHFNFRKLPIYIFLMFCIEMWRL